MNGTHNRWPIGAHMQLGAFLLCLLCIDTAAAEIRTITSTGEYRMGDNDTRTDAKRLALLDAKRLALEQAGTYVESVTQVKNLNLTAEEIRAYTAGIVEVTELATLTSMEGETTVVRVDVSIKIDTDMMAQQINALRKNEMAKRRLLEAEIEASKLRKELEAKTLELRVLKGRGEVEEVARQREKLITHTSVNNLVTRAWGIFAASRFEKPSAKERKAVRSLAQQALVLDPFDPSAHMILGLCFYYEKSYDAAIREYRSAIRYASDYALSIHFTARVHGLLGHALWDKGEHSGAITQYRTMLQLESGFPLDHKTLGLWLADTGDLSGAIEEFRFALRQDATDPEAHLFLGDALDMAGDPTGALRELRSTLLLNPNEAVAYTAHKRLADVLAETANFTDALAEYHLVLSLKPEVVEFHYRIADMLMALGNLSEAVKEYREFLRLAPDTPDNRPFIKQVQVKLRELER